MTVSPQEFLAVAKTLIQNQNEIHDRSATNRAYYGAFHACTQLQQAYCMTVIPEKGGSHEKLISSLKNCPIPNQNGLTQQYAKQIRSLGKILLKIKNLRVHADYHIATPFPKNKAQLALQFSTTILQKSNQILSPPTP